VHLRKLIEFLDCIFEPEFSKASLIENAHSPRLPVVCPDDIFYKWTARPVQATHAGFSTPDLPQKPLADYPDLLKTIQECYIVFWEPKKFKT